MSAAAAAAGAAAVDTNAARAIEIVNVSKRYGDMTALDSVSLEIHSNEFFTLLGPSGCGKTTMLRIIAGFEEVSGGAVFLFGDEIENLPPHRRPINTVFQSYALFPHMTVQDNVLFGLRMRKMPDAQARARAAEMLELVKLSEYARQRPAQLSGGQRQRVALARALAPAPRVLLLDESLSALDLKLRQAMRVELKQIQRETGITFVFVTHDQDEAMTMSDRIAVMSRGRLQQVGAPREIYEQPVNRFVADFIGDVNLLRGEISQTADGAVCMLAGGHRFSLGDSAATVGARDVAIRPEQLRLVAVGDGMPAVVERQTYVGAATETLVRLENGPLLTARAHNLRSAPPPPAVGAAVGVAVEPGAARVLME